MGGKKGLISIIIYFFKKNNNNTNREGFPETLDPTPGVPRLLGSFVVGTFLRATWFISEPTRNEPITPAKGAVISGSQNFFFNNNK